MVRKALILVMGIWLCLPAILAGDPPPPNDIPWAHFAKVWPDLAPCISDIESGDIPSAKACLGDLIHQDKSSDGAYNLRAQLHRNEKEFDQAKEDIEQAISLKPDHDLHHYQKGLIAKYQIQNTGNPMKKWKLSNAAYEAHEKALALDPTQFAYRQYIVMHKLQAPAIAGGDKEGALKLANEGIEMEIDACLPLRAYCFLSMEKDGDAFADLDASIEKDLFSYVTFKAGGDRAAELKKDDLARKYYGYIAEKIPDRPFAQYILAEYLWKQKDREGAEKAFAKVVELQPDYMDAAKKLAEIRRNTP